MTIELIVGLANPGERYENTRHNAGAWFLCESIRDFNAHFRLETKLKAQLAQTESNTKRLRFAIPTTYMNESGLAIAAILKFYKIAPENMLVVHDEIDLPPGTARLKFSGGEGGHNGLRSIVSSIGTRDFHRLRLGVGHPGHSDEVANYVLKQPSKSEQHLIDAAIQNSLAVLPDVLDGDIEKAMMRLHTES